MAAVEKSGIVLQICAEFLLNSVIVLTDGQVQSRPRSVLDMPDEVWFDVIPHARRFAAPAGNGSAQLDVPLRIHGASRTSTLTAVCGMGLAEEGSSYFCLECLLRTAGLKTGVME